MSVGDKFEDGFVAAIVIIILSGAFLGMAYDCGRTVRSGEINGAIARGVCYGRGLGMLEDGGCSPPVPDGGAR
jgi:hypothetical protein